MKTITLPEFFNRWRQATNWPIFRSTPETAREAQVRKADQLAANQEWEDEGGTTTKQPPTTGAKAPR